MKTKSGLSMTSLGGEGTNKPAGDPTKCEADNHSHKYLEAAEASEMKTKDSEVERKETLGSKKTVCERVKKVNSYNKKSCDRCTYHLDACNAKKEESSTPTIEGDLVLGLTMKSCDANI